MKLNCSFISVRMKRCVFIWFYSLLYLKEEKKKGGGRKRRRRKKNERGRDEKWRKSKMIEMESPSRKVEENISSSLACFFSFSFFFSLSSYLRGFQRFFQARRIRPCSPLHHAFETLFFFSSGCVVCVFQWWISVTIRKCNVPAVSSATTCLCDATCPVSSAITSPSHLGFRSRLSTSTPPRWEVSEQPTIPPTYPLTTPAHK